jgi:hypothetical protein
MRRGRREMYYRGKIGSVIDKSVAVVNAFFFK